MPFPRKICVVCSEEFELRPDKPGFANRCLACSEAEAEAEAAPRDLSSGNDEQDAARRKAIRDLLYQGDS